MAKAAKVSLVLGGARSGKSQYAEKLVVQSGLDKVYLATGQAGDKEMRKRIAHHQFRRGADWVTIETKVLLADALIAETREDRMVLVDCLTFWLSNLLFEKMNIEEETEKLLICFKQLAGPVVFVSNEVGLGVVPKNKLGRAFRDYQGRLNQQVAAEADHVVFMAAGLPLVMKPQP